MAKGNNLVERAETLLNDYNYYRSFTANIRTKRAAGRPIGGVGHAASTRSKWLTAFKNLDDFCRGHGLDSRRWLASLFEIRHWTFAPPLKHLQSVKHLKRYPALGDVPSYRQRIAEEQRVVDAAEGRIFRASRDISHSAETLKIRYVQHLDRPGRCMELMDETLGFHPQSKICETCPLASPCETMLESRVDYNIQAVRRGDMTLDQALTLVAYGGR